MIRRIKLFSLPTERVESPMNIHLAQLVPVIYGAVFSYTMYVFSKLGVELFEAYAKREENSVGNTIVPAIDVCWKSIIAYFVITLYMIGDVGAVMKINGKYRYKRTSRYTQEYFVALGYIFTFSLLYINRVWAILPFTCVVFLGGLWFNNMKEELSKQNRSFTKFARSQRKWHYACAALLIVEYSVHFIVPRIDVLENGVVSFIFVKCYILLFGATISAWGIVSKKQMIHKHGPMVIEFGVPFMPDHFLNGFLARRNS